MSRTPFSVAQTNMLMLCGEYVKVKNGFLDDIVRDNPSSNESTLTAEAATCPELYARRRSEGLSSSSASASSALEACEEHTLMTPPGTLPNTLTNTLGYGYEEALPMPSMDETQRLIDALRAMPNAPFGHLLLPEANAAPLPVLSTQPEERFLASDSCPTSPASPASPADQKTTRTRGKRHPPAKIWTHFFIEPSMLRNGFEVNKKLIGHGGANTKRIYEKTGCKIRLRGRGSGHAEGGRGEAPVPLMLAVTSDLRNLQNFVTAMEMSAQLLHTVTSKYPDFCRHQGPALVPQPLFWIGELSQEALECLNRASESQVLLGDQRVTISLDARAPQLGARN
ncbi:unnamed protein product [Effrenium voratum]|nr:unnamed protein product [Effrenium voratum]